MVRDLAKHVAKEVTMHGWINTLHLQRKIQFLLIHDHTGLGQVTNKRTKLASEVASIFESVASLESAVTVVGKVWTILWSSSVVWNRSRRQYRRSTAPSLHCRFNRTPRSITVWTGDSSDLQYRPPPDLRDAEQFRARPEHALTAVNDGHGKAIQREHRYDVLVAQAQKWQLHP
jgi:hypothetical protein